MSNVPKTTLPIKDGYELVPIIKPFSVEHYLEYYNAVGKHLDWTDRLGLKQDDLYQAINKENAHLFTMQVQGKIVGYTELVIEDNYVELLYFGLFSTETGKGYGPHFLDLIIHKAWSFSPQWVQLNTCDLDHPKALPLYQKKGFKTYATRQK